MGDYFRVSSEELTWTLRPKKPERGIPGGGKSKCKGPEVEAYSL